jgi:hypothetical protein
LENIALHPDVKAEWAPNEKVALEAAFGASYAGARERGYGSVSVLNEGQPESKAKTIYYSFSALLTPDHPWGNLLRCIHHHRSGGRSGFVWNIGWLFYIQTIIISKDVPIIRKDGNQFRGNPS